MCVQPEKKVSQGEEVFIHQIYLIPPRYGGKMSSLSKAASIGMVNPLRYVS